MLTSPQAPPRSPQDLPRTLPRGPKMAPRGPKEAPKRPPRGSQETPKRPQEAPKRTSTQGCPRLQQHCNNMRPLPLSSSACPSYCALLQHLLPPVIFGSSSLSCQHVSANVRCWLHTTPKCMGVAGDAPQALSIRPPTGRPCLALR